LRTVAAAGEQTMARLKTDPVRWMSEFTFGPEAKLQVELRYAGPIMRAEFSTLRKARHDRLLTIISRDGFWYVDEGGRRGKYRPYEAPFVTPLVYPLLQRAQISCLTPEMAAAYEGPARENLGRVALHSPLPESKRASMAHAAEYLETLPEENFDTSGRERLALLITALKSQEDDKLDIEVDVASGIVTRVETPKLPLRIEGFKWGESDDPAWSQVVDSEYTDNTEAALSDDNKSDIAMLCHQHGWKLGEPAREGDVTLVNIKTGAAWRAPFPGGPGLPGCFSKDRHKIYMTGPSAHEGTLGLYEIDLKSGAVKPIAEELWSAGASLLAYDVSPDGRRLAALRVWPGLGAATTVEVVDLESGEHRTIGEPIDTPVLSWLPGGEALLVVDRNYRTDPAAEADPMIFRLTLDGERHSLLHGARAWTLGDQSRILFETPRAARRWQTCDLQGKDEKPIGDGLARFDNPSPSPDGKKILMMLPPSRVQPAAVVHLIDATTGRDGKLRLNAGRWTNPKW
jgi:hypothetical protein